MRKYFGTDGVRGVANQELTAELAFRLGFALGYTLVQDNKEKPRVLVGQDPRISSDMLSFALSAGLTSVGCIVEDAYILPTPAISNIIMRGNYQAGAMISASHNPYYDNGIKFFDDEGYKLTDEQEKRIEELLNKVETLPRPIREDIGFRVKSEGLEEKYISFALQVLGGRELSTLSIGLDCANGATSFVAPKIFTETGAAVSVIHDEPTGTNINLKSGSTHPEALQKFVIDNELDVGFAFDGDGDRVIAVDEKGQVVDGDEILSIIGVWMKNRGILSRNTLVATVMSNLGLEDMGEAEEITIETAQVGDRYVLDLMKEKDYNLGGEPSGHIIMLDHSNTGDGVIAALVLARILEEYEMPFSELNQFLIKRPQELVNVRVNRENLADFEKHLGYNRVIRKAENSLGNEGRILVRASGTEPVIRVMVEGKNTILIKEIADDIAVYLEKEFS